MRLLRSAVLAGTLLITCLALSVGGGLASVSGLLLVQGGVERVRLAASGDLARQRRADDTRVSAIETLLLLFGMSLGFWAGVVTWKRVARRFGVPEDEIQRATRTRRAPPVP